MPRHGPAVPVPTGLHLARYVLRRREGSVLTVNAATEHADAYHTPHELRIEFSDADPNRRQRNPLLDNPSDPHPYINALMDLALLRLMVVANGATQAWGPDAGMRRGVKTSGSVILTDPDAWTIDQLAWDYYYGATTHRGRLRVLKQAQDMAKEASASDPGLRRGTREWRQRIIEDPRSSRVCERIYGVSHMTIARIRKQAVADSGRNTTCVERTAACNVISTMQGA
jgi:hypothetical protein